jgi:RND family efflux transporter MFP subunit
LLFNLQEIISGPCFFFGRVAVVVGCAATMLLVSSCGSSPTASGAQALATNTETEIRTVKASAVRSGSISRTVEVNGTLAAQDEVVLAFKVAGRIESLRVDLGDTIREGQVLASLDKTDFRLAVEQAEAALEQARARLGLAPGSDSSNVDVEATPLVQQARAALDEARLARERAKEMLDAKLIARADFDTAEANYQIADGRYQDAIEEIRNRQATLMQRKTELELTRQMLRDAELQAPISGAILERTASAGQYVAPGTAVVRLVRMKPLRLQLPVPERAANGVKIGQEIRLSLEGDSNSYKGYVSRLSPAIDPLNRTLLVEATIPNEAGRLKPGSFVRASLVTLQSEDALFIPAQALVVFAGIEKAFVIEDGKSAEKLIRTGRRNGDEVEVLEGLSAGERVVVQPGSLVGGMAVQVEGE